LPSQGLSGGSKCSAAERWDKTFRNLSVSTSFGVTRCLDSLSETAAIDCSFDLQGFWVWVSTRLDRLANGPGVYVGFTGRNRSWYCSQYRCTSCLILVLWI